MYYIYKIENMINNKKYIGLTNSIERRRARHFTDLRCNRHDNKFLQKEVNIYGLQNFSFTIEFEGDVSVEEISQKEREFIAKYDSYKEGYNQNEGGNFGPSNGGTKFTRSDILNILAVLEFLPRPGQVLADIYDTSRTTIGRIKRGDNHAQYKEEYEAMPLEERQTIYESFKEGMNLMKVKAASRGIQENRALNQEQVFLILRNVQDKKRIVLQKKLAEYLKVAVGTIKAIETRQSYLDCALAYDELTFDQKEQLASLLRNLQV